MLLFVCGLFVAGQAPVRPDFSGDWILDASKMTQSGAPMRIGGAGRASGSVPTGMVTEPKKVKHVSPIYPPEAQRSKISGRILLEAIIDRQGKVKDLRLLTLVPELDRAAMDAVSRWEYTPTLVAGVPVEVIMTVTVTFTLTGQPTQMGVPVGSSNWPSQPAGAVRPGMGRGFTSPEATITQTNDSLTFVRKFGDAREEIRYRFDGRPSTNNLPGTGGAVDNRYVYVSRWEGEKLVSTITWVGPQGPRERTEMLWIEGDLLKMATSRAATEPGAEPFITTNVFTRKK